jgi:hypothetical protein
MAEKKKVITNQAEIDAANRANVAKLLNEKAATCRKVVAAARALKRADQLFTQALSGAGGVTTALQAQIKAATQNPTGNL